MFGPDTYKLEIKNSKIYYDFDISIFKLNFKSTNASNYTEREVVGYLREFIENDFIDLLKQKLIEEDGKPSKIIELNEKQLITKYDGEITIQKRIN